MCCNIPKTFLYIFLYTYIIASLIVLYMHSIYMYRCMFICGLIILCNYSFLYCFLLVLSNLYFY